MNAKQVSKNQIAALKATVAINGTKPSMGVLKHIKIENGSMIASAIDTVTTVSNMNHYDSVGYVDAKLLLGAVKSLSDVDLIDDTFYTNGLRIAGKNDNQYDDGTVFGSQFDEFNSTLAFVLTPDNYADFIGKNLDFMGKNDVRYYLNGLSVNVPNYDGVSIASSDGSRLLETKLDNQLTCLVSTKFILSRDCVNVLSKIKPQGNVAVHVMNYEVKDDIVRPLAVKFVFKSDNIIIETVTIDAQYPSFQRVLDNAIQNCVSFTKKHLVDTVTQVSKLIETTYCGILFEFNETSVDLRINNYDTITKSIPYSGTVTKESDFSIGLNAKYLLAALSTTTDTNVTLQFADDLSFVKLSTKNTNAIVMAMRL